MDLSPLWSNVTIWHTPHRDLEILLMDFLGIFIWNQDSMGMWMKEVFIRRYPQLTELSSSRLKWLRKPFALISNRCFQVIDQLFEVLTSPFFSDSCSTYNFWKLAYGICLQCRIICLTCSKYQKSLKSQYQLQFQFIFNKKRNVFT